MMKPIFMLSIYSLFGFILSVIWKIIVWTWWIFLPIWLLKQFSKQWRNFAVFFYLTSSVKYKLLELRVPKNVIKTPKSMENIFSTFSVIKGGVKDNWVDLKKKYVKGETQLHLSLEIVGTSKGISFYIWTPAQFQNLIESQIYAQYPAAEITEVSDYINVFPKNLPDKNFDIFGVDMMLAKDSAYPIKTYPYFEEVMEEKRLDPLASLMEVMSRLRGDDQIWFQVLMKYPSEDWKKKSDEVVNDLAGKKKAPKPVGWSGFTKEFATNLVKAPIKDPKWSFAKAPDSKDAPASQMQHLTSGVKDAIKAIEEKSSKLGFESFIRFLYIGRKATFDKQNISSIMGSLNQFSTQNLNSFKPCSETKISVDPPFKDRRDFVRKRLMYVSYRLRLFNPFTKSILNTEELATLYHFPIIAVEAPFLKRIQAKKGEPPANLPI